MILIQRWSNANSEQAYREQPFGDIRLATRVQGGNLIGTPDYFPFFKADVSENAEILLSDRKGARQPHDSRTIL